MRKLLKKQVFAPEVMVTDKLRSYEAARAELGLSVRHEQGQRKNNRAENDTSRSVGASARCSGSSRRDLTQRFLSAHAAVYKTFNIERHLVSRKTMKAFRTAVMTAWCAATSGAD